MPQLEQSDITTDLYDVTLRVTVRAYHKRDAEHLAHIYEDRVRNLAPAWPVELVSVESSAREAI